MAGELVAEIANTRRAKNDLRKNWLVPNNEYKPITNKFTSHLLLGLAPKNKSGTGYCFGSQNKKLHVQRVWSRIVHSFIDSNAKEKIELVVCKNHPLLFSWKMKTCGTRLLTRDKPCINSNILTKPPVPPTPL